MSLASMDRVSSPAVSVIALMSSIRSRAESFIVLKLIRRRLISSAFHKGKRGIIRIHIYLSAVKISGMDPRLLDVIIGLSGFFVLIVMLAVLPQIMVAGFAYIAAVVIFIMFLSGAGYLVNEKIL